MTRHQDSSSNLRTPTELAKGAGVQPPLGEFLWKATRQVRFRSPVVSASGRYADDGVYCERGETCYYREYVRPADPKTSRQMAQRSTFGGSQSDWKNLTPGQREAWSDYGRRYFAEERSSSPGPNLYTKVHSCRRGWGEETMVHTPPVIPPPPLPVGLQELAAPEDGWLVFRLEHGIQIPAGYRLEVRMTPATINGRKPQEPEFRRAGESAPESFFPLAASGAEYLLERPRYTVAPGARFGLGVRLVTPEGVPGPELRVDLIRRAPEEPASAAPERPESILDGAVARPRTQAAAGTDYLAAAHLLAGNAGFSLGTAGVPPAEGPSGIRGRLIGHSAPPGVYAGGTPAVPGETPGPGEAA